MPPYKEDSDGNLVWWDAEDWAKEKARRKLVNQQAFKAAKKEVVPTKPLDTREGQKERVAIFKQKLLTEENGNAVIKKVIAVALDDEHPGQMAALKLCLDRMLPTSLFDEKKAHGDRPAISINITGIGEPQIIEGEVLEADSDV